MAESLEAELLALGSAARDAIRAARVLPEIIALRNQFLGRRDGSLTRLIRQVGTAPVAARPHLGQLANRIRQELTALLEQRQTELGQESPEHRSPLDVTLPGRLRRLGAPHLITRTTEELVDILTRLGFQERIGPEIEDDWHNFTALNFKPDHPARDNWAGFYLPGDLLLRSHTSPVQIRAMEQQPPPIRIVATGRCYRPDPFDASHSPVFHQIEGLCVGVDVSLAHLKGTLGLLVKEFFGPEVRIRLSPSYFPFTEPSAELAATCTVCQGQGCSACKNTGWIELLGCGMVHPNVLRNVGYNVERYTGYAFGFGVERFAMVKYGIPDIRLFFENDVRFLRQFPS